LHTCLMTLFNKNNFTKYFAFDVVDRIFAAGLPLFSAVI